MARVDSLPFEQPAHCAHELTPRNQTLPQCPSKRADGNQLIARARECCARVRAHARADCCARWRTAHVRMGVRARRACAVLVESEGSSDYTYIYIYICICICIYTTIRACARKLALHIRCGFNGAFVRVCVCVCVRACVRACITVLNVSSSSPPLLRHPPAAPRASAAENGDYMS
jgi:hypothetical protein